MKPSLLRRLVCSLTAPTVVAVLAACTPPAPIPTPSPNVSQQSTDSGGNLPGWSPTTPPEAEVDPQAFADEHADLINEIKKVMVDFGITQWGTPEIRFANYGPAQGCAAMAAYAGYGGDITAFTKGALAPLNEVVKRYGFEESPTIYQSPGASMVFVANKEDGTHVDVSVGNSTGILLETTAQPQQCG